MRQSLCAPRRVDWRHTSPIRVSWASLSIETPLLEPTASADLVGAPYRVPSTSGQPSCCPVPDHEP